LLAGRTRHHGHTRSQDIVTNQLEIGVAAAEEARKLLLHPGIDALEGLLEAGPGLPVDPPHRLIEGIQGGGQIGKLAIEVLLALALLLQLVNSREVYLTELLQVRTDLRQRMFPVWDAGVRRQILLDLSKLEMGLGELLRNRLATYARLLGG